MAYTILTRAGLADMLHDRPPASSQALHLRLNPGLATDEELAQLRDAGATVELLAAPLDATAALALAAADGGVQWVEASAVQQPVPPAEVSPSPRLRQKVALAGRLLARALRHASAPRRLMLLPYVGYGNASTMWLQGRVLDERAFGSQQADDSGWRNLANLYRALESDEVAGATVQASVGGRDYHAVTDRGGYFSFAIHFDTPPAPGWLTVALRLPREDQGSAPAVQASAQVLVPAASARFGVISDIDDTVLWTNVTNKLNMALLMARSNFHTRQAFKGVAAFYRALRDGVASGSGVDNPIFYVSNSPWHLYASLRGFLDLQGMPPGPLLLRTLGLGQLLNHGQHANSKLERIEAILAAYPGLPFVLIGDSGERDPEIYAELVRRHPGAISAIYIRNVNPDPSRIAALDALIAQVSASGAQLVVAADSEAAASHAAGAGLIDVARLPEIRAGVVAAGAVSTAQPGGSR